MSYVNHPKPEPTQGQPSIFALAKQALSPMRPPRFTHRGNLWMVGMMALAALLTLLVAWLAISPPYDGLSLDLHPSRLIAPAQSYLFRNAITNTGWLLVGVYLIALPLGWAWAVTGITLRLRPFLLLPLFVPGVLLGLLWRPLFEPWLNLSQAQISLMATAIVLLWQAIPLAAWLFSWDRDAWPQFIAYTLLLVLLNGDLIFTLTRGEPFNAAHTWPSWLVQQLWTMRNWGHAAIMAGALAIVLALLIWLSSIPTRSRIYIPHGSPLGDFIAYIWLPAPFLIALVAFLQSPGQAFNQLFSLGAHIWLLNGLLLWSGTTLLVTRVHWPLPTARQRRTTRALTLFMLPIAIVAFAYLGDTLPFLGNRWTILAITTLLTIGLLLGDEKITIPTHRWFRATGYAALVIAHTFALQLVLQLPPIAWTPTLGIVWTLSEATHAPNALGAALLLYGAWATLGSWLLLYPTTSQQQSRTSDVDF